MHTIYDMGDGKRSTQDAQRMSEQQVTIERLIAREVVLRNVLTAAVERIVNQLSVGYDATDIDMWEAALINPSPQADAVRVVLETSIALQVAHDEYIKQLETATDLPNAEIDKVSEEMDKSDAEWTSAVDAYLAVTRGDDPARGPHVEPRGPGGDG